MHDPLTRRQFVGTLAASVAATWVAGPSGRHSPPRDACSPRRSCATLDAITALILPTDDTPGAREARVVDFIDRSLASFAADQRPLFDAGLGRSQCPGRGAASRRRELRRSRRGGRRRPCWPSSSASSPSSSRRCGSPTITGFLANPEYGGNAGKVGWHADRVRRPLRVVRAVRLVRRRRLARSVAARPAFRRHHVSVYCPPSVNSVSFARRSSLGWSLGQALRWVESPR